MRTLLFLSLLCLCAASLPAREPDSLQLQREAFMRALRAAETGNWSDVEPELARLEGYPLRDDLRGAWLAARASKAPEGEIRDYLEEFPDLYASSRLRLRWTDRLYQEKRWKEFQDLYALYYAQGDDTTQHCKSVIAQREGGDMSGLAERALQLWLVGYSQPRDCDAVFAWLEAQQLLTAARYRQRLELALAAGNFTLADYLARPLTDSDRALVDLYRRIAKRPELELAGQNFKNTEIARSLIIGGLESLARRDPDRAWQLWRKKFRRNFSFTGQQRHEMERTVALWSAWHFQPNSLKRMSSLPPPEHTPDTLEAWARAALYLGDWKAVHQAIAAMPDDLAVQDGWQYWGARAMQARGESEPARQMLLALAQKRSYYGFLAADSLSTPYALANRQTPPDEVVLAELGTHPDLLRAGELFATGLYTRGRQEWDAAVRRLDPSQQVQATILAHRLGWHSRAIALAARQQLYDDLALRYPGAFMDLFQGATRAAGIDMAWAMGIARSESLFMPDVKSPAGALGLMQLMPATGAATAREFSVPYSGSYSLLDPETNIRLGTRYLEKMQSRFNNNLALATAAYNAGPNRISGWLPESGTMPADLWIETLPYRETRNYVRRVLESRVIFAWTLERENLRLRDILDPVPSMEQLQAQLLANRAQAPSTR
jgi:soluble lytic murein transglycosylase